MADHKEVTLKTRCPIVWRGVGQTDMSRSFIRAEDLFPISNFLHMITFRI